MRLRLSLPDALTARVDAFAAALYIDRQAAIAILCAEALAARADASAGGPSAPFHVASPGALDAPDDPAAADALRAALGRILGAATHGRVRHLAAQNLMDEAGLDGDAAWREATRVLHDAGWRQGPDDGDVWTAP